MIDKKSILVTIGIPFYKDVDTLAYAIKSVQRQTWENFELILLDDGGNDGSLEIARKFLSDSRVSLVSDGKNKGLPHRLNELIDMAKGKYFARMDADDIMHPSRIEEQVKFLEANPDIDVLGTGAYSIDVNNHVLGEKNKKPIKFTSADLFKQTVVMHPTVMARLSWYKRNRYCIESWAVRAEDFELWCRSWDNSKFYNLDKKLMFYREGNSIRKTVDNQILTYNAKIATIKKYGRKYISLKLWIILIVISEIKKYVYYILRGLKVLHVFQKYILSKRYMKINKSEKDLAEKILSGILKDG